MSLITPDELKILCDMSKGRLLGLDVGSKNVGLALSDKGHIIATPYYVLERLGWKKDLPYLINLIHAQDVVACVVGWPINMDGSIGERCAYVMEFYEKMQEAIDIPVLFWDERLSTIAAERVLLEADMSRKRRSEVVDKMAASYILQGVLDRLRKMS